MTIMGIVLVIGIIILVVTIGVLVRVRVKQTFQPFQIRPAALPGRLSEHACSAPRCECLFASGETRTKTYGPTAYGSLSAVGTMTAKTSEMAVRALFFSRAASTGSPVRGSARERVAVALATTVEE